MLNGKTEFRLGSEQRVCGPGDVVIDFFAPPRGDFLLGGKPAYISEG
jgi:hypothetical protein